MLVTDFFVYVTVLNSSGSGSAVGPEGEVPGAPAVYLYDKVVLGSIEITGKA